jgi:hypothetical protein
MMMTMSMTMMNDNVTMDVRIICETLTNLAITCHLLSLLLANLALAPSARPAFRRPKHDRFEACDCLCL